MKLDDIIKDNIIIITPNIIKKKILLKLSDEKKMLNIKFMELKEFIDSATFKYNEEAIYFLMNKYGYKYEVSKVYLDNIKYEIDKLSKIKKELEDNNLLIKDNNISLFLKNKEIYLYGYDYVDKYDLNILNNFNVKIIEKEYKNYKHDIFGFKNIDDELEFISNKIIDLINSGISINKIKLANVTSEYYLPLKRIFNFYNIPINLVNETSIYDTNIISDFIKLIEENDIKKTLNILENKYDMKNDNNYYIYNKLIDTLNKYTFVDDISKIMPMLIHDFKKIKNRQETIKNSIEIIDLKNNIIFDDEYVFLIGFNQGNIPIIFKDEDFLSDKVKNKLGIETSVEKNIKEREAIKNIIKTIKNLMITYKLKTPFDEYIVSPLINELDFNHIKNVEHINKYSNKMNLIRLSSKLDNFLKFGVKDDELDVLYNNYKNIKYRKFNNEYTGINKKDLEEYLNNKLLLSYSSIDNYYRCSFRYYLNNILKLTEFETTFAINIGNIFHYVLSKCFDDNFDFEKEYEEASKNMEFTISDKFFLKKLKEELKFIIDTIKKQNEFSSLKDSLYENKVFINKEGNIKLTFMGIIDKLMYKKENDKTYLVIVDYKTGNIPVNLNNTIYGIGMQLPVYLYLAKNCEKIENAEVIGFYLQKILNSEIVKEKGKSYQSQKKNNLKLQGYSINDESLLSKFDFSYKDSEVVKSLKVGNNGFYAYSKIISKEEIDKLIEITKQNIDNAFDDILNAKFDINPKKIGKINVGCEYCKFKDICFMKNEDIVELEEYKNLEFLRG